MRQVAHESGGFNQAGALGTHMQCHYCDREAAITAESNGIRVGLCEEHFQERMEELAESEELAALRREFDVDRCE